MADFNNQWIEIFRAGDYGDKGNWDEMQLAMVVKNFNDGVWTPPVVFGHPQEDSPAHGWVKDLMLDGEVLKAKFKQTTPQLETSARDGRFPNRSAAFYFDPKGKGPVLRHVGFLGATPPEVKGLAPIRFSSADFIAFDGDERKPMSNGRYPVDPSSVKLLSRAREIERANSTMSFGEALKQARHESSQRKPDRTKLFGRAFDIVKATPSISFGEAMGQALSESTGQQTPGGRIMVDPESVKLHAHAIELQTKYPDLPPGQVLRLAREQLYPESVNGHGVVATPEGKAQWPEWMILQAKNEKDWNRRLDAMSQAVLGALTAAQ